MTDPHPLEYSRPLPKGEVEVWDTVQKNEVQTSILADAAGYNFPRHECPGLRSLREKDRERSCAEPCARSGSWQRNKVQRSGITTGERLVYLIESPATVPLLRRPQSKLGYSSSLKQSLKMVSVRWFQPVRLERKRERSCAR